MGAIHQFGANVASFQLETGYWICYIIERYLSTDDALTIESVITALGEIPQGSELLVDGYFNAKLARPEGADKDDEIAAYLAVAGLKDMLAHFILHQCPWCQYGRTRRMAYLGREVRSWMDYILGMDLYLFRNMSIQDHRHNSDHYLILGRLHSATLREHTKYLGQITRLPIRPLTTPTREDKIFTDLQQEIPNPKVW